MRYGPPKAVTSRLFEVMCFLVTHKTYKSTTCVLPKVKKKPKPPEVFNLCIQETLSGKRVDTNTRLSIGWKTRPGGHTGQACVGSRVSCLPGSRGGGGRNPEA